MKSGTTKFDTNKNWLSLNCLTFTFGLELSRIGIVSSIWVSFEYMHPYLSQMKANKPFLCYRRSVESRRKHHILTKQQYITFSPVPSSLPLPKSNWFFVRFPVLRVASLCLFFGHPSGYSFVSSFAIAAFFALHSRLSSP